MDSPYKTDIRIEANLDMLSMFSQTETPQRWPHWPENVGQHCNIYSPVKTIFTCKSSYCFQRILAIAILSVCPSIRLSITRVDQSKTVQARITKSSPTAAWKTLVSGTVKLFSTNSKGSPRTRALNERGWAKFAIFGQ